MFRSYRLVRLVLMAVALLAALPAVQASELEALAISDNIQQLHMPYGTILDPVFASSDPSSPDYRQIVSYARCADSAIWTGHYLAAEAFRYKVTQSPEALSHVRRTLLGIRGLLDVTGTDVLARCFIPVDSPFASAIQQEGPGIYSNTLEDQACLWLGNTTRDQYSGVMFGLSVAYDMVDEPDVQDKLEPT
ncbi:MAG: hypothetical protein HY645_11305 [Acidobacteria bacterium]|nr:hypothetical protein [Acidobacteriota bacterium]